MAQIADEPLACIPFSPNWYLPQIISFCHWSPHILAAFGVNNQIYIVDVILKKHVANLQVEASEASKGKIAKEEIVHKVTALKFHENFLIAGLNNGAVHIWGVAMQTKDGVSTFEFNRLFCSDTNVQAIFYIFTNEFSNGLLTVVDAHGTSLLLSLSLQEMQLKNIKIFIVPKQRETKIKSFFALWNFYFLLFEGGQIEIWCPETKTVLFETQLNKRIVDFDYYVEEGELSSCRFLFVLKKSKKIELLYHRFGREDLVRLQQNKLKELSSPNACVLEEKPMKGDFLSITNAIELTFVLTGKLNKDKSVAKTWLCIKWLNPTQFIISGKIGDIYLLGIHIFEKHTSLSFKPFSAEIGNQKPPYHILNDNPHSKGIFGLFSFKGAPGEEETLVSLGLDRKIVFWRYDSEDVEETILYEWRISCLGAKANSMTSSVVERNLVFMSCEDNTIRFWAINKKNNAYFCQDASKGLSDFGIKRLKTSNIKEGLVALKGENSKIALYDVYNETILKTIVRNDCNVLDFFFFPSESAGLLTRLSCEKESSAFKEFAQGKINITTSKDRQTKIKGESLVAVYSDLSFLVWELEKEEVDEKDLGKLESLGKENCEYTAAAVGVYKEMSNTEMIGSLERYPTILVGDRNGFLHGYCINKDNGPKLFSKRLHKNSINSIKFNIFEKLEEMMVALGSYDRKLTVIRLKSDKQSLLTETVFRFKHKVPILNVKWSSANKILAVGLHNTSIQIWDCSANPGETYLNKSEPSKNGLAIEQLEEKEEGEIVPETLPFEDMEASTEGREVCNIRGHKGYVTDAEFSMIDPNMVVSASDDQSVRLWNIENIKNKKVANKKKKKKN